MNAKRLLLAALLLFGTAATHRLRAQNGTTEFRPADVPAAVPPYVYCRIICRSNLSWAEENVFFDFGQPTGAWSFNYLSDSEGRPYLFHSGIQALNFLVARGWEFVQAFSTGKEAEHTHLLLRIDPARLPQEVVAQLLAEPPHKPTAAERKNASEARK